MRKKLVRCSRHFEKTLLEFFEMNKYFPFHLVTRVSDDFFLDLYSFLSIMRVKFKNEKKTSFIF